MIPPDLTDLMPEPERSVILSHRITDPEALLQYGNGRDYAIFVFQADQIIHVTPWVPFSQVPSEFRMPLSSRNLERALRVKIARRTWYYGPTGRYSITFRSLGYTFIAGIVKIQKASLSASKSYLRKQALSLKSRLPARRRSSSSGRPNPEEYFLNFGWFEANELGAVTGTKVKPVYQRQWSGVRTPGFHSLKKRQLPVNPHHVVIRNAYDGGLVSWQSYSTGTWSCSFQPYEENLGGSLGNDVPDISFTRARNRAISRLADKANAGVNNLAESVATVRQLDRMISNNFRKITRAYRAVRRLDFAAAADALWTPQLARRPYREPPSKVKSLADNWLELQYGWKPLLKDIEFVVDTVARLKIVDTYITSARASATEKQRTVMQLTEDDPINGGTFIAGSGFIDQSVTSKFGVRFSVSDQQRALMAQSGFLNPVSLAWELLPFSFVVDWALPLGPYLESFTQWEGLQFRDGWEVSFRRKVNAYSAEYERIYKDSSQTIKWGRSGNFYSERIELTRGPISVFPSPKFPSFKNPFTVTHSLNALALLKSVFSR